MACDLSLEEYLLQKEKLFTESPSWSYENQEEWRAFPNFYSTLKLPINIDTNRTVPGEISIDINYEKNATGILAVYKKTIFFFPTESNNFVTYNDKNYKFIGFHIHQSSENTINNLFYPIEIHFVNEYVNPITKVIDYVVIALLFAHTNGEGAEITNLDYRSLFQGNEIPITFDLSIFNNLPINKHYNFPGTLTSPPFNQNTNFFLFEPKDVKTTNLVINDNFFDTLKYFFISNKANILAPVNESRYLTDNNYIAIKTVNCCNNH